MKVFKLIVSLGKLLQLLGASASKSVHLNFSGLISKVKGWMTLGLSKLVRKGPDHNYFRLFGVTCSFCQIIVLFLLFF